MKIEQKDLSAASSIFTEVEGLETEISAKEVIILDALIASVKPIIRYMDKEIKGGFQCINGDEGRGVTEYYDERGILIYDGFTREYHSESSGFYVGTAVYLTRDGWLMELSREGRFDNSPRSKCYWKAGWSPITTLECVQKYCIEQINQEIYYALNAGVESALEKQRKLESRLEVVSAIAESFSGKGLLIKGKF